MRSFKYSKLRKALAKLDKQAPQRFTKATMEALARPMSTARDSLKEQLICAFVWEDTEQGHTYWEHLYHKLPGVED